jgi:hypothetical protein
MRPTPWLPSKPPRESSFPQRNSNQQTPADEAQVHAGSSFRLDVPPRSTELPHANVADPSNQIASQDHFGPLMRTNRDVLNRIIDLDIRTIDFTARRDKEALDRVVQQYHHLCVNKQLNGQIREHPSYAAAKVQIRWLRTLNSASRRQLSTADISMLIDSDTNVTLPGHPHAQRRRTDVFIHGV